MSNNIAVMVAAASTVLIVSNGWAGPREDCRAAQGTFLSGTVVSPPRSVPGHERQGVELSHTHIRLLADQDHRTYDVAIDNIFAAGYDRAGHHVPDPLTQIQSNTRVAVCGKLYRDGTGIDWVHTNCGDPPRRQAPDGSIRIIDSAGNVGPNLEDNQEYCSIFR